MSPQVGWARFRFGLSLGRSTCHAIRYESHEVWHAFLSFAIGTITVLCSPTANDASPSAKTAVEALTSLHRDHWFKKLPPQRQRLIDAIENQCVLRFVAGYPLRPDLGLQAATVQRAIPALGTNVTLATFSLDEFRANFTSEDEGKNVLVPMNHALDCKRKANQSKWFIQKK